MTEPRDEDFTDDPTKQWFEENPGEVPFEVRNYADEAGYSDVSDEPLRELLEMDPDLFGDWDRFA